MIPVKKLDEIGEYAEKHGFDYKPSKKKMSALFIDKELHALSVKYSAISSSGSIHVHLLTGNRIDIDTSKKLSNYLLTACRIMEMLQKEVIQE